MKSKSLLFTLLVVILCGCSKKEDTVVEKYGISFVCPADWKLTDATEEDGYSYICVEKSGFSSSGLVQFSMVEIEDESDFAFDDYLESYSSSIAANNLAPNIKFTEIKESVYGEYPALLSTYTVDFLTVPHQGSVYMFYLNGKAICISYQEANEDEKKNKAGFDKITASFKVN
ncbi:MAG: hypothetical protein LBT25_04480 [Candidatus Symbiothrix sp.]|jgi:hypothetical protein|nr:hypothetical protein [Candidatus Symbiothrix sp.]